MSEMLDPLYWVSGLFIAVIFLIVMEIIDIPMGKYRLRKLEQKITHLQQLLSSYVEETISNSETIGQEPPQ